MVKGDRLWWILGGAFVGLAAVAIIIGFCSRRRSRRPHPTPGSEGYAHYPPYKLTDGPYYDWPHTGVNSITSPSGWRYENLSRYVDEQIPTSGIDVFGARFGPGYLSPPKQWWSREPQLAQSVVARHQTQRLDGYLPQNAMASPIGGLALDTPVGKERLDPVRQNYHHDEKESFVQTDLTRDDGVPPDALEPTIKRTRESTHTGWREPQYDQYRNPMAKACYDTDWKNDYPFWPVPYEYPWRDPLYDMRYTGLYTINNADPENLKEQRLWPKAY
jgi:hypothetical protein